MIDKTDVFQQAAKLRVANKWDGCLVIGTIGNSRIYGASFVDSSEVNKIFDIANAYVSLGKIRAEVERLRDEYKIDRRIIEHDTCQTILDFIDKED